MENEDSVISFLVSLVLMKRQSKVLGVAEWQVLQILCSGAVGILNSSLLRDLESGEAIEGVSVRILSDFVREYIRYGLLSKYYTRRQRHHESLLDFIEDISLMSDIFRLGLPEREMVKVILSGTHCAEVRVQLVLARPPSTLRELEEVCKRLQNLGSYRDVGSPGPPVGAERNDRCFRCGRPGHLARECERPRWGQVMGDRRIRIGRGGHD